MTGFILGGYAKHPNAEGNENGVFASPYVLQRVPATKLQAVLSEINDDVLSQINNEELYTFETADQVLTELSNAQDYLTEQDLTTDETIYDEVPDTFVTIASGTVTVHPTGRENRSDMNDSLAEQRIELNGQSATRWRCIRRSANATVT